MTDKTELQEAIEYFKETKEWRENLNDSEEMRVNLIITAAEMVEGLQDRYWKLSNEIVGLRAKLSQLPEVVTVYEMCGHIHAWRFDDTTSRTFGEYLAQKYPNGLKIVKGK